MRTDHQQIRGTVKFKFLSLRCLVYPLDNALDNQDEEDEPDYN